MGNRKKRKKEIILFTIMNLGVFGVITTLNLILSNPLFWSLEIIPFCIAIHKFSQWSVALVSVIFLVAAELLSHKIELINIVINSVLFYVLAFNAIQSRKNFELNAFIDPLTKAFNRRFLEYFTSTNKKMAKMSVQMLDIDHFKHINDTYGHDAGDYVLKEIVQVIMPEIRKTDKLFRLGGEEFSVVLPNANCKESFRIAERIRAKIEKHQFEYEEAIIPVTVSVGMSTQNKNIDCNCLMKKADEALYKAKNMGRNRTRFVPSF